MPDAGLGAGRGPVLRFLDDLRAAEAAGATVFEAWAAVCAADALRGGLRTIAEREAGNATLLADRLGELGVPCEAAVRDSLRFAALARFGAAEVSDDDKLGLLLARYDDDHAVGRPIARVLDELDPDLETREILRLVAAGEQATIAWLRAYRGQG